MHCVACITSSVQRKTKRTKFALKNNKAIGYCIYSGTENAHRPRLVDVISTALWRTTADSVTTAG